VSTPDIVMTLSSIRIFF